jgi:hypothetical protein
MRRILLAAVFSAWAIPVVAQTPPPSQPRDDRFQEFVDDSVGSPLFYLQATAAGVLDQMANFPDEWHGSSGFARRDAARIGQAFGAEAIGHAAAAALRHRVAYDPCTCAGFARLGHAMSRAFVSLKADGSGLAPNWSLWISKYSDLHSSGRRRASQRRDSHRGRPQCAPRVFA